MGVMNIAIERGLVFLPVHPIALRKFARELRQGNDPQGVAYCTVRPNPWLKTSKRAYVEHDTGINDQALPDCYIYWFTNDTWQLSVWEGHPGPRTDDFVRVFPSFDTAMEAVMAFYFGTPLTIQEWVVPLHRHPELEEAQVRTAIMKATLITKSNLKHVQDELVTDAKAHGLTSHWDIAWASDFLCFAHESDPHRTCWMRRNMSEAYIVDDRVV